jgi:hypothetical protein
MTGLPTRIEAGEATDAWFCNRGGFWGTVHQLLLCARCGKREQKRQDEPCYRSMKPAPHMICDECFAALPDDEPALIRATETENG